MDCCWFFNAASSVCQANVAHLTRAGYSRTPANTASLPTACALPLSGPQAQLACVRTGAPQAAQAVDSRRYQSSTGWQGAQGRIHPTPTR